MEIFFRFAIYGIVGLTAETIFRTLGFAIQKRSLSFQFPPLVMFPVYGSSVFLFDPVHTVFLVSGWPLSLRLAMYLPGLYLVELFAGLSILKITGRYAWRYDGAWQYKHLINFAYIPFWIPFLVLWEYIHIMTDWLFI